MMSSTPSAAAKMKREDLADWYLRLNGCLTVSNFVLHPERRGGQRGEADVVAVRFPHRAEFNDEGADDPLFATIARPLFMVAEAKAGDCELNASWIRDEKAILYVLKRFALLTRNKLETIARVWFENGFYSDSELSCSFLCFGERRSENLHYPQIPQKTWGEVLLFFHRRFSSYSRRKSDHEQWDVVGKVIWDTWKKSRRDCRAFVEIVKLGLS